MAVHEHTEGPLPSAKMLREYSQVLEDLPERIVARFESEGEHRQAMERKIIEAQIDDQATQRAMAKRGQSFAFALGVVGLAISGFCVYTAETAGAAYAGASIATVGLGALVGAFVIGRKVKPSDEDEQAKSK